MATKKQNKKAAEAAKKKREMNNLTEKKVWSNNDVKKLLAIVKSKDNALPIFDYVMLNKDKIVFGNFETTISLPYISNVEGCIPYKIFKGLLEDYENGEYNKVDDKKIQFSSGEDKVQLSSEKNDEYPKFENVGDKIDSIGNISQSTIDKMVIALKFVGSDELRPVMQQVYLFDEVVSTDAHMMFHESISESDKVSEICLFNKESVKIISHIGGDWNITKERCGSVNRIVCESIATGVQIFFRECDAKYPNYKAVIPKNKELTTRFEINSSELLPVLKRASRYSNQTTKQIRFYVTPDGIEISAEDRDFDNEFKTNVKAKTQGKIEIGFNYSFLKEIIEFVNGKTVFKMSAPNRAALINHNFLIMPVMLNA